MLSVCVQFFPKMSLVLVAKVPSPGTIEFAHENFDFSFYVVRLWLMKQVVIF